MGVLSVSVPRLGRALKQVWDENLIDRFRHRRSVPYPETIEQAMLSLPNVYEMWKQDYINAGGEVDWEIIRPESQMRNSV